MIRAAKLNVLPMKGDEAMPRTKTAPKREPRKPHPRLKKALHVLLMTLLAVILVALFYLAVILGQPEEPENAIDINQTQPLLTASPALNIQSERQVAALAEAFPVPVLAFMEGMGPVLVSGTSYDQAYEGGFARICELRYTTDNGLEITLTTIYPARAVELLGKDGYTLTGAAAQNLTGLTAVRMENADHIRLHAQANDAIYALTLPKLTDDTLTTVTRVLELVSKESASGT